MSTRRSLMLAALCAALTTPAITAEDWAAWRGRDRNGTSYDTNLIDGWSVDGENLIWRRDFVGRSTPVAIAGKVCANGRVGEGIDRQEMVACFDAGSGELLWERRFNVYHTSVPWTRVGWPEIAADPETGYLYVQGVGGIFSCLDSRDGSIVWQRRFIEEYGFMEGYGGRTQTPLVDGDRVVITFSNTSWGAEGRPLHRLRAFDKRTGELLWVSQPADSQADKNTQSTPNILIVDGRRLIVAGNGSGGIYAVEATTGEPVWGFKLSQRGINTSVVVDGTTVYASHSEENVDEGTMGRVVAIDGTGTGDVTATHEIWRAPIGAGFSSPALADGALYVLDNSANLYALDAETGEQRWKLKVGRVGKASPVVADGKIYLTEVNGRFVVVELGEDEAKILDSEAIELPDGREPEIYSSVAVAYGRLYFTTEEGIYCLGDPDKPFAPTPAKGLPWPPEEPAPAGAAAARLLVVPYEDLVRPDGTADFRALAFDAKGRALGEVEASWTLAGLDGAIDGDGVFRPAAGTAAQTGAVVATSDALSARGRLRVLPYLPLAEDFEAVESGTRPPYFMAYTSRFEVAEVDGQKVLRKGPSPVQIDRHITFVGHPDETGYTIEADLYSTQEGRRPADLGLINSGYTAELLGNHQRLQVRSWQSGLRMMREIDFPWEPNVWYRMKLRVRPAADRAVIDTKVWKRGEDEPADWTLTVEDPHPIPAGAPGLSGYSPTPIYFDNLKVTKNP